MKRLSAALAALFAVLAWLAPVVPARAEVAPGPPFPDPVVGYTQVKRLGRRRARRHVELADPEPGRDVRRLGTIGNTPSSGGGGGGAGGGF